MPTYSVNAINISSFNLGESDKILTLFSSERGLLRAVAKGARKPGAKIGGRAELLAVNKLLLAQGRSLDIITQAESLETFKSIRTDLTRLSYALYYAELTVHVGQGLNQESDIYFELLLESLRQLCDVQNDPAQLCLSFQLSLLNILGFKPELENCILCRKRLLDQDLEVFDHDLGGLICNQCFKNNNVNARTRLRISESQKHYNDDFEYNTEKGGSPYFTHITPLVWKKLILATYHKGDQRKHHIQSTELMNKTLIAARHLMETYIEHRIGKKMKSLALI